jgi:Zn-dependent protease with chaperone function
MLPWCTCCSPAPPRAGASSSRRLFLRVTAAAAFAGGTSAASAREGVEVGPPSVASKLVPAEQIERAAGGQYQQMLGQARTKRALAPENHPQMRRLREIASRLIPHTDEWNPRARAWNWEVNLIGSPQINAFCMPGGKIAFYYGILDKLQLSDDEVAMIMGHEMTHALREHAREQMGKTMATRGAIELGAAIFGLGSGGRIVADMGGQLLTLRFGRDDEKEADLIGLELAARAGYDPRAGVTLWQKMGQASRRQSIDFLSTHPSSDTRIQGIQAAIPEVDALYARAEKPPRRFGPPAPQAAVGGAERQPGR